jgi:hypothetical protein
MQEVLPRTLPGLQSLHLLVNREKHELTTIAYYETRAAAIAPDAAGARVENRKISERLAELLTGQGERTLYEGVAQLAQSESAQVNESG